MVMVVHGIPKHDFFCIVQPYNKDKHSILFKSGKSKDWQYPVISLKDPISEKIFKAQMYDMWSFPISDMPNMFTLLTYGQPADKLRKVLLKRYPELTRANAKVEYWLLKKI